MVQSASTSKTLYDVEVSCYSTDSVAEKGRDVESDLMSVRITPNTQMVDK